jgi:hypothetical protein
VLRDQIPIRAVDVDDEPNLHRDSAQLPNQIAAAAAPIVAT